MKKAKELRAEAREALTGCYWQVVGATVIFAVAVFVLNFLNAIPVIGAIAALILTVPLSFGFIMNIMKIRNKETESIFDMFKLGYENFGRSWKIVGNVLKKLLIPILIVIGVSIVCSIVMVASVAGAVVTAVGGSTNGLLGFGLAGIVSYIAILASSIYLAVRGLLYELAEFIAVDNPEMAEKEAVEKSETLMMGNRWRFICMELSFIGWMILAAIPFGLGYVFLLPYMMFTILAFYEELAGKKEPTVTAVPQEAVEVEATPVVEEAPVAEAPVAEETPVIDVNE